MPNNHLWLVKRIFGVGEVGTKGVNGREGQIGPGREVTAGSTYRTYPAVQSAIGWNIWTLEVLTRVRRRRLQLTMLDFDFDHPNNQYTSRTQTHLDRSWDHTGDGERDCRKYRVANHHRNRLVGIPIGAGEQQDRN
jgi:hypothetical protein